MFIKRKMEKILLQVSQQYPVVAIMGPRQSGKTTLAQNTFPEYNYVSMADIDSRMRAQQDPRQFFTMYENGKGLIIDEMQEVPELFSYMQGVVDRSKKIGFFIITGSSNFLLMKNITQSLAGRIALLELMPLSLDELAHANLQALSLEQFLVKGFYPRLYSQQGLHPSLWYANYITTYLERDVRQLINVGDIVSFQKFLKLCAARVGNLLNYTEIARDCNVSSNTIKAWISILETSYIIKLLHPYYKNYSKRVIKAPKIYFYDVGIVCRLLDMQEPQELHTHPMRGALIENLVLNEIAKYYLNSGQKPQLYFWRDVQGHEIDCIIEKSYDQTIAIEIKSSMTVIPRFYKEITDWNNISEQNNIGYIVYAGSQRFSGTQANIIPWNQTSSMLEEISKAPRASVEENI